MKEFKKCIICSSTDFKPVFMKNWSTSHFHKCSQCNLIFQNPQEDLKTTNNRYKNEYFQYEVSNQENFFCLIKKTLSDFAIYRLLPEKSNVLEIGSATGLFLKHMNELGHRCTGIEICSESVAYGIKNYGVNLLNCRLEDSNFDDNSFNFIHFSHLIEHVNSPDKFLEEIFRISKPGGYSLITTPNQAGIFSNFYSENWRCIVDDHLFLFSKDNLGRLLKKCGFEIIKLLTWGSIPQATNMKFIKKLSDRFVKKTGTGDVMCYLVKKPGI